MTPSATLLDGGTLYVPAPNGRGSVLVIGDRIASIGALAPADVERSLRRLGMELDVLAADGLIVAPGLIDPHEHLLGSSGESGFSSRTPEIFCTELIEAGITTVVGTLGTDSTMRTLAELLAKVKALREDGLTTFMYSGGYTLPPRTVMSALRDDLLYLDPVIGAGEIAISDKRTLQPDARALAGVIVDAYVGGTLSRKAGVTHIHVGEGEDRLAPIREVLDQFDVEPAVIYPTHVARTPELLREAVDLTHRGCFVDIDTTDGELPRWVEQFMDAGGDLTHLTVSTDADTSTPTNLLDQVSACAARWPLERILPLVTSNTARVLKLETKGRIAAGADADLIALRPGSFEPVHVVARGRVLMRDGRIDARPAFLRASDRQVVLRGEKA
jgi:beta-aspartyl-dipeptidase (metallo-type)